MRGKASWKYSALLAVAAAAAAAPGALHAASPKIEPATVEAIAGSDLHRLILQARAAERLGIETMATKTAMVWRKRIVAAEIVPVEAVVTNADPAANAGQSDANPGVHDGIWLKVLPIWDAAAISRDLPAQVFPASSRDTFAPQTAQPGVPPKAEAGALYYFLKDGGALLNRKNRVLVELAYKPARRTPVPRSATFYDANGGTWVYEMTAPLTYVRHAVRVAYYEDEVAYLDDGPAEGAQIVTVGGQLLQGVEFKVGH